MASGKAYLDIIPEQLSDPEGVSRRAMTGENIICYHGKAELSAQKPGKNGRA